MHKTLSSIPSTEWGGEGGEGKGKGEGRKGRKKHSIGRDQIGRIGRNSNFLILVAEKNQLEGEYIQLCTQLRKLVRECGSVQSLDFKSQ
jgi:hypothetical protein